MLTELPRACLEHVYDLLHVHDRLRLNMALPAACRVTQTKRTDSRKDARLAAACLALKRRRQRGDVGRVSRTSRISALLEEEAEDPTVRALVVEHAEVLPVQMQMGQAQAPGQQGLVQRVNSVCASADASGDPEFLRSVVDDVIRSGTPALFAALVDASPEAAKRLCDDALLFNLVVCGNEALAAHVLADGEALYARHGLDTDELVRFIVSGPGRTLASTDSFRGELLLRLLPHNDALRERVLGGMYNDLDVDAIKRTARAL
jgi:hypothetical protein